MDGVQINADEMDHVINMLNSLMTNIVNVSMPAFENIKNQKFYLEGESKEEIEKIFSSELRTGENGTDLKQVEADLYGKIQMLVTYYNLIKEFCVDAINKLAALDEDMAKLLNKTMKGISIE